MTTKVDGLSWTALGTIVGFLVLIVVVYGLLHHGIHSRIDEVRADIAVIQTDVADIQTDVAVLQTDVAVLKTDMADLKADMEVVIALLERVERGQSAGSVPAKPSARPAKLGSPGQPEARRGHRPIGTPANDTASK